MTERRSIWSMWIMGRHMGAVPDDRAQIYLHYEDKYKKHRMDLFFFNTQHEERHILEAGSEQIKNEAKTILLLN